jgi:hypothetical protein
MTSVAAAGDGNIIGDDRSLGGGETVVPMWCECGKVMTADPPAREKRPRPSRHNRKKRKKKLPPPDSLTRLDVVNETTAVVYSAPVITITNEEEDENGAAGEDVSTTTSTSGAGAADEGIYDGNSSSLDSTSNTGGSKQVSRKSSYDVPVPVPVPAVDDQRHRKLSYHARGDAISLMIIEGCELCQERIQKEEAANIAMMAKKMESTAAAGARMKKTSVGATSAASSSSTATGKERHRKQHTNRVSS